MGPVIQIIGSLFILVPFVLAQLGRVTPSALGYIVLNLIGSTVLAVDAMYEEQWGFLLLEAVWAGVSLLALVRVLRGKDPQVAAH